jgi:hypothetical protein
VPPGALDALVVANADVIAARATVRRYAARLARTPGVGYGAPDAQNLYRALLVAAARPAQAPPVASAPVLLDSALREALAPEQSPRDTAGPRRAAANTTPYKAGRARARG